MDMELEQTPGDRGGQGRLACCGPWGHRVRHDLATTTPWATFPPSSFRKFPLTPSLGEVPFLAVPIATTTSSKGSPSHTFLFFSPTSMSEVASHFNTPRFFGHILHAILGSPNRLNDFFNLHILQVNTLCCKIQFHTPATTVSYRTVACMLSHFSRGRLFATPMDCSLPSSSVHGDSPGKNTGVGRHALLQGSS